MRQDFAGRVAIVTGAGRGISAATARLLARRGARVALLARTRAELEQEADELGRDQALPIVADVADEAQVIAAFRAVRERWGPATLLASNAGALAISPLVDMDVATFDRVVAVNVRGTFLCARELLRDAMASRSGGSIVNVASISGVPRTSKFPGLAAYAASKAAVLSLTETLAEEARPLGVRVNAVSPGSTATRMLEEAAPDARPTLTPDQVANVIVFCLSDEGSALHGAFVDAWGMP